MLFFMGGKDHSSALRALIEELGITQREAAERLSKLSGDSVAERTVRTWLADRHVDGARRCPGWPVALLKLSPRRGK